MTKLLLLAVVALCLQAVLGQDTTTPCPNGNADCLPETTYLTCVGGTCACPAQSTWDDVDSPDGRCRLHPNRQCTNGNGNQPCHLQSTCITQGSTNTHCVCNNGFTAQDDDCVESDQALPGQPCGLPGVPNSPTCEGQGTTSDCVLPEGGNAYVCECLPGHIPVTGECRPSARATLDGPCEATIDEITDRFCGFDFASCRGTPDTTCQCDVGYQSNGQTPPTCELAPRAQAAIGGPCIPTQPPKPGAICDTDNKECSAEGICGCAAGFTPNSNGQSCKPTTELIIAKIGGDCVKYPLRAGEAECTYTDASCVTEGQNPIGKCLCEAAFQPSTAANEDCTNFRIVERAYKQSCVPVPRKAGDGICAANSNTTCAQTDNVYTCQCASGYVEVGEGASVHCEQGSGAAIMGVVSVFAILIQQAFLASRN